MGVEFCGCQLFQQVYGNANFVDSFSFMNNDVLHNLLSGQGILHKIQECKSMH